MRIMKQDLLEILVDIFKSSGYNVIISSQCDILVEKNGHQAYVRCALQPDYEEIKVFSEKIEELYRNLCDDPENIWGINRLCS